MKIFLENFQEIYNKICRNWGENWKVFKNNLDLGKNLKIEKIDIQVPENFEKNLLLEIYNKTCRNREENWRVLKNIPGDLGKNLKIEKIDI